ncbi:hypothetical protein FXE52_10790 [Vibrio cholerae]|nr:hypothetical protein FXE52_10790 [Vibrio cholerae]
MPTKPERNSKGIDNHNLLIFLWIKHNARLRGWQRITTKLKHNNRNHRGSMGLETPRVDSPS